MHNTITYAVYAKTLHIKQQTIVIISRGKSRNKITKTHLMRQKDTLHGNTELNHLVINPLTTQPAVNYCLDCGCSNEIFNDHVIRYSSVSYTHLTPIMITFNNALMSKHAHFPIIHVHIPVFLFKH